MIFPDILQVEDDEDFAYFMISAIGNIDNALKIHITPNGNEALAILTTLSDSDKQPGMMLLDINLPGMSGMDLLKKIRNLTQFDSVPIIIFSTSDSPHDEEKALSNGANDFCTKPSGYINLIECLRSITKQWLKN